jgi:integrase
MSGRLYKRGKIWWCWYYRDGTRTCASTRCQDKRAAEAVLRERERHAADPDYAAAHSTTIDDALGRFLIDRTNKSRAEGTLRCYRVKAGHLSRLLGSSTKLATVNASSVDEYISARRNEGASQHTIYKELGVLRGTLKVAKRRGEFHGDIAAIMLDGFASGYKPRDRTITPDQARRLFAELPKDRAAHMAFILATGARRSEAERARAGDIDWARGIVRLRGTKTAKADRAVPIAGFSVELLEFVEAYAAAEGGKLFRRWSNFNRALSAACVRAGVSAAATGIDAYDQSISTQSEVQQAPSQQAALSPNDLRRSYATWLRERGIEPNLLASALGHTDSRMVERVYGRLRPEALAELFRRQLNLAERRGAQAADATGKWDRTSHVANQNATSLQDPEYGPPTTLERRRQDAWQQSDSTNAGKSGGAGSTMLTGTDSASRPSAATNAQRKR